jgi:hypothetical protein
VRHVLWIRIGFNADPDPGTRIGSFTVEIIVQFFILIVINLSLGLHEGHPSYRINLQHSKENILDFNTLHFSTFIFSWSFLPTSPHGSRSGSITLGEAYLGKTWIVLFLLAHSGGHQSPLKWNKQ